MNLNILFSQSSQTVKALEEEALSIVTHVIILEVYFTNFALQCSLMSLYA